MAKQLHTTHNMQITSQALVFVIGMHASVLGLPVPMHKPHNTTANSTLYEANKCVQENQCIPKSLICQARCFGETALRSDRDYCENKTYSAGVNHADAVTLCMNDTRSQCSDGCDSDERACTSQKCGVCALLSSLVEQSIITKCNKCNDLQCRISCMSSESARQMSPLVTGANPACRPATEQEKAIAANTQQIEKCTAERLHGMTPTWDASCTGDISTACRAPTKAEADSYLEEDLVRTRTYYACLRQGLRK